VLDPADAPADELAALYAQRWEIESIFDELKTHQRGPRAILRSRTPEGVYQEAWGYLCVHYALRALIHDAADHNDLDPDRISFTKTLHAARRSVRTGLSGTVNLATALAPGQSARSCTRCSPNAGYAPTPASSAAR
jgi:Transposase DDE domain.